MDQGSTMEIYFGRLMNWVLQKLRTLIGQLATVHICYWLTNVKQIYELSCLQVHGFHLPTFLIVLMYICILYCFLKSLELEGSLSSTFLNAIVWWYLFLIPARGSVLYFMFVKRYFVPRRARGVIEDTVWHVARLRPNAQSWTLEPQGNEITWKLNSSSCNEDLRRFWHFLDSPPHQGPDNNPSAKDS